MFQMLAGVMPMLQGLMGSVSAAAGAAGGGAGAGDVLGGLMGGGGGGGGATPEDMFGAITGEDESDEQAILDEKFKAKMMESRKGEMQEYAAAGGRDMSQPSGYRDMSNFANVGNIKSLMHSQPRQSAQVPMGKRTGVDDEYLRSLLGG